jgi:multidrug efflux pump subunit AcrA (membrane-fusion protein)
VRLRSSWHLLLLGLVGAGAVLAAVLELGPPTSSARTSREVVTAAKGVVQSTVSGTGNVEPGTEVEANFQTSGTLQHLYAKVGDHVVKGQLLATLDPTAAQNTLDQAEASLTSAQDQLTNAEQATVTTTTSQPVVASSVQYVALRPTQTTSTTGSATTTRSATTTTPATTTAPTTTTTARTTTPSRGSSGGGTSTGTGSTGSTGTSASSGETAATKAANIAAAQASVDGAEASVTTATTALHETHVYAPATGTVVSVESISPGDEVSGSSSGTSSSSSPGSSASGGTSTTSAGSLGGSASSGSSASSSSSSSGLVEIVNTSKMTMTVAFSESDISKIRAGQAATVTLDALTGVELAAHVSSVSTLATTSSSVVSYDATLTLDQRDSRVKPGMSASAAVVTGQAQGVTLPNSAVTGTGSLTTVDLLHNGKTSSTRVVVGLRGDSRTQIVSGLSAGDQVVVTTTLPSLSSSSSTGSSGTLGTGATGATGRGRFGGTGGFGGGGLTGGGGFAGGGPPG